MQIRRQYLQMSGAVAGTVIVENPLSKSGRRVRNTFIRQLVLVNGEEVVHALGGQDRPVPISRRTLPAAAIVVGIGIKQHRYCRGHAGSIGAAPTMKDYRVLGVIQNLELLGHNGLALAAALLGSTLAALVATVATFLLVAKSTTPKGQGGE